MAKKDIAKKKRTGGKNFSEEQLRITGFKTNDVKENAEAKERSTFKDVKAEDASNGIDAVDNRKVRKIKQVYISQNGETERKITTKIIRGNDDIEEAIYRQTASVMEDDDTRIFDPVLHAEVIYKNKDFLNAHEDKSRHVRVFRIALVVVVLIFSIAISSAMGIALALWDSDTKVSELTGIVFPGLVKASTLDDSEKADVPGEDSVAVAERKSAVNIIDSEEISDAQNTHDSNDSDLTGANSETADEGQDDEAAESSLQEVTYITGGGGEDSSAGQITGLNSYVRAGKSDELVNSGVDNTVPVTYANPDKDYPLSFTSVDESYFTDALFIGDSRLQGFGLWSAVPATFYCATGFQLYKYETTKVVQTENGKVPIFEALPYDAFTKIYIKVGLNEMGWGNEEKFEALYAEVIAKLREMEPRAVIYIHGLLPVTAEKSASHATHNNPNIIKRNEALKAFAANQKAYYIDAGEALMGEDGCLPAEMTSDGVHLKAQYMPIWKEYLMSHAVLVR